MDFTHGEWRWTAPATRDLALKNTRGQEPSPYSPERILAEVIGASLTHVRGNGEDLSAFRLAAAHQAIVIGTQVLGSQSEGYTLRVWIHPDKAYTLTITRDQGGA